LPNYEQYIFFIEQSIYIATSHWFPPVY
jgi:hypothetical protein